LPGKHAPDSPRSFFLSVARAGGAVAAAVLLLVVIVVAATGSKAPKGDLATARDTPTSSASPSATGSGSALASPQPSVTKPAAPASPKARASVTIAVLNGTSPPRNGLAGKVAAQLENDGWKNVVVLANTAKTANTTVGYRTDARLEAIELHDVHPELGKVVHVDDSPKDAMIVIKLGNDYPK
jgi:hypothetical protein